MDLPKLTSKQQEILNLLYTFRFLNRIQIQTFLKHKDYKTINLWLKDLHENQYVERIYSTHFAEKTKPAIYNLGINAVRHFRALGRNDDELRKRYRDTKRSQAYINRSILLADCCLELEASRGEEADNKDYWGEYWHFYETEADYHGDSYYSFLVDSDIRPNLCFSKEVWEGLGEPYSTKTYLLHIFDATLPRYHMKKYLHDYVTYLDEEADTWKEQTNTKDVPIILFACERKSDLIYAKRKLKGSLADIWEYDDIDRPHFRLTTIDKIKQFGLLAEPHWEAI